jgi:hypothetical protein
MDADELERNRWLSLVVGVAFRRNNKWCFWRVNKFGSRLW